MSTDLAIVIPVYKKEYLAEAVESIRNQTDKRFNVYIGDDASPHDLGAIIKKLNLPGNFHYHRFNENMGQHSLVKQWMRCIKLSKNEQWIWLFSDDDIADKNCVELFYTSKKKNPGFDVYRFNTKKVNEECVVQRENIFPGVVSAADFLNIKLNYRQESYIVEGIFNREAFNRAGGIPDLPLAWASDDMFWTKLAMNNGIFTTPDAWINWRFSGLNISSRKERKTGMIKLKAARIFLKWIYNQPSLTSELEPDDLPVRWYIRQLKTLRKDLNTFQQLMAVASATSVSVKVWYYYLQLLKNESRITGWLKRYS